MRYLGWAMGLLPFFWFHTGGANPVTDAVHLFGLSAMVFLLGSLGIRPLVQIGKLRVLQPWKKIFGLLGCIYASLHALIYIALDQGWDVAELLEDFTKRVHIRFGMLALLFLMPLALTSNARSQRWLGKKWKRLHSLVFPIGILYGLHYMLARKTGFDRASWALVIVLGLIVLRFKPLIRRLQSFLPTAGGKERG